MLHNPHAQDRCSLLFVSTANFIIPFILYIRYRKMDRVTPEGTSYLGSVLMNWNKKHEDDDTHKLLYKPELDPDSDSDFETWEPKCGGDTFMAAFFQGGPVSPLADIGVVLDPKKKAVPDDEDEDLPTKLDSTRDSPLIIRQAATLPDERRPQEEVHDRLYVAPKLSARLSGQAEAAAAWVQRVASRSALEKETPTDHPRGTRLSLSSSQGSHMSLKPSKSHTSDANAGLTAHLVAEEVEMGTGMSLAILETAQALPHSEAHGAASTHLTSLTVPGQLQTRTSQVNTGSRITSPHSPDQAIVPENSQFSGLRPKSHSSGAHGSHLSIAASLRHRGSSSLHAAPPEIIEETPNMPEMEKQFKAFPSWIPLDSLTIAWSALVFMSLSILVVIFYDVILGAQGVDVFGLGQ